MEENYVKLRDKTNTVSFLTTVTPIYSNSKQRLLKCDSSDTSTKTSTPFTPRNECKKSESCLNLTQDSGYKSADLYKSCFELCDCSTDQLHDQQLLCSHNFPSTSVSNDCKRSPAREKAETLKGDSSASVRRKVFKSLLNVPTISSPECHIKTSRLLSPSDCSDLIKRTVEQFSPEGGGYLIGRKIGEESFDIVGKLYEMNLHVTLRSLLAFLQPTDLVRYLSGLMH